VADTGTRTDGEKAFDRVQDLREGLLWSAMELLEESTATETLPGMARAVVGASVVASTGYVFLNSRAIYWLISALSTRPLWKGFDPLEVIFAWEEEQKEERKKARRPHFRPRRGGGNGDSLQSLVGESESEPRMGARTRKEVVR
jgi:hypothetical protein